MRIVAHVHMAAPEHGAGAEWMLQAIAAWLVDRGHQFTILASSAAPGRRSHQGVTIVGSPDPDEIDAEWEWADVAVTHLDRTLEAMLLCSRHRKPLVHLVHNDQQLAFHGVNPGTAQLVVFNSHWLREANSWWQQDAMVVYPPCLVNDYSGCEGGDAVTLINLQAAKGALSFYAAARELPHRAWLAVEGAWGVQLKDETHARVWPNQADVRTVYRETRVLLMPSWYESWGRCAIEAACSGIPTIAHPTPGLVEALGSAGLFCDRDNVGELCRMIEQLYTSDVYYQSASALAAERALELEGVSLTQLGVLEERLERLVGQKPGGFGPLHPSQQGWTG